MDAPLVMHIDDAPWLKKRTDPANNNRLHGDQLIGDIDRGPWIHIVTVEAARIVSPHLHDQDEVIYIVDGGILLGDQHCGPGTVICIKRNTEYGFTVEDTGVRFLNIRPGLAMTTMNGQTFDPYHAD